MKEKDIQRETSQIVEDVLEKANLKQGSIFVLGLSSSEVIGGQIGKESSQEIGEIIVKTILDILEEKGIHLAVQGCEHVNRALVVASRPKLIGGARAHYPQDSIRKS